MGARECSKASELGMISQLKSSEHFEFEVETTRRHVPVKLQTFKVSSRMFETRARALATPTLKEVQRQKVWSSTECRD